LKKYISHICVLAAGILWGMIGIWNRNLMAAGLSVGSIVLVRNMGSLLLLGLLFLLTDRGAFRIAPKHLPVFAGTGIVSVLLFTICYFSCQKFCSLAVAAVLLYTAPAFVVILSAVFFREKITGRKLAALLVAFFGCTCVTGVWSGTLEATVWGAVCGVASGLFYGLYSIFGTVALRHYPSSTVTFYTFAFAGAGALFLLRPAELAVCVSSPRLALLTLCLVVVSTVGPYLLYTKGLQGLGGSRAAILASIEPVAAAVVGVLAFGEPMRLMTVAGLVCILVSVYILR